MNRPGARAIAGLNALFSTILYIILLILYSEQAKYTFQVSRMLKAEYCQVDFLGHKSQSLKKVSVDVGLSVSVGVSVDM